MEKPIPGPSEIIREMILGYQQAVNRGDLTSEEANDRISSTMTILNILHAQGVPMDTGSTQVRELLGELEGRTGQ